jgi:hypothetical protein
MVAILLQAQHDTKTQKKILDSRSVPGMTKEWKDCCDIHASHYQQLNRGRLRANMPETLRLFV